MINFKRLNLENHERTSEKLETNIEEILKSCKHMGSSTETVAFQVYEILKINHEFLQFF